MQVSQMKVKAFAKVNLSLDVLGKRPDGYHEVAMVMQAVDLADTIELAEQPAGISITVNVPGLPADSANLAYRAAALLAAECGVTKGVAIAIDKRIPLAAGLAGGSADAAAVLEGLNSLWRLNLPMARLEALGARLGSDVPFCLRRGTALATGRGEILTALPPLPACFFVLATPRIEVSTAWVYCRFRPETAGKRPDTPAMLAALKRGDLGVVARAAANVLESVTARAYPEVEELKKYMLQQGALASLMSGSGPTVFALTPDPVVAERIAAGLRPCKGMNVALARPVQENQEEKNGAAVKPD